MKSRCVLCGGEYKNGGCDPWPLSEQGRCCHHCNSKVIEARLAEPVTVAELIGVAIDDLERGDPIIVSTADDQLCGKFERIVKVNDSYVMVISRPYRNSGHPGINDPGSYVIPTKKITSIVRD